MVFKIGLPEYQKQLLFQVYWPCKTHPHQNTASINPNITISKWNHLRLEQPLRSLFSVEFQNGPRAKLFYFRVDFCRCTFMILQYAPCPFHKRIRTSAVLSNTCRKLEITKNHKTLGHNGRLPGNSSNIQYSSHRNFDRIFQKQFEVGAMRWYEILTGNVHFVSLSVFRSYFQCFDISLGYNFNM